MKRFLDIVLILVSLPIMLPVALIVAIAIKLDSPGPVLYWSERIGQNGRPFIMPKFRSMSVGAPIVEAEKFTNAGSYITKNGRTCISGDDKANLDIEYMRKRSLLFDIKIIVLTIWKVVKQDDIVH